jgi:hypothetical protein
MQGVGICFDTGGCASTARRAAVGVDVSFIAVEYKIQFFLGLISLGLIVLGHTGNTVAVHVKSTSSSSGSRPVCLSRPRPLHHLSSPPWPDLLSPRYLSPLRPLDSD